MDEIKKVLCEYGIELQDMYNSFGSDELELVYDKDGVEMYYAPDYMYMDIIGLTDEQWKELRKAMGEIDHLEFNDNQIQDIIVALNYHREQKIKDRIEWPNRMRFDFTEDDVIAIPIIIGKLKSDLSKITYTEIYVIDSAIENYSFNTFNYDSEERKHYDRIHKILKNYKSYIQEHRKEVR
jgi:hypothetical protein